MEKWHIVKLQIRGFDAHSGNELFSFLVAKQTAALSSTKNWTVLEEQSVYTGFPLTTLLYMGKSMKFFFNKSIFYLGRAALGCPKEPSCDEL